MRLVYVHRPQTLPGGFLKMNTRFNTPFTISKRCKVVGRSQRDCILEWARLNPEKILSFLDRLADDPKWQITFRGLYDSLRLLYLRLFNEEARVVALMELQLKHRVELMLSEERICLERHEQEFAVRKAHVMYLESVSVESELRNELTGELSCHLCQSGRQGGSPTRKDRG